MKGAPGRSVFDLRPVRQSRGYRNRQRMSWIVLGMFVTILSSTTLLGGLIVFSRRWSPPYVAFEVGAVAFTVLFFAVWRLFAPGPTQIEVGGDGIRLIYERGHPLFIPWTSPDKPIRLGRTDGAPDLISNGGPAFVLHGGKPEKILLTLEAFDAIVSTARAKGFIVEAAPTRGGWTSLSIRPGHV